MRRVSAVAPLALSPQGRIGASRSTRGWHSHDLADDTSRAGTLVPCVRASSPTMLRSSVAASAPLHGSASASGGSSCSPAR